MKALTVIQPYADMIARGEKIIENRRWATAYRGPIAIHAGKSRAWLDAEDITERPWMVFGAIVATATLTDCVRWEDLPAELTSRDDAEGPWCWLLDEVVALQAPIVCKGERGLWEWAAGREPGSDDE